MWIWDFNHLSSEIKSVGVYLAFLWQLAVEDLWLGELKTSVKKAVPTTVGEQKGHEAEKLPRFTDVNGLKRHF